MLIWGDLLVKQGKNCNRSREAALNWQESSEAIVRKLLQKLTEGLKKGERKNSFVYPKWPEVGSEIWI
ncbi:hypothetical protein BSK56_11910 [Paenibacillus borealis]|uniref:Uncharacterized protein n=1 Tax=Paenibacillus borealis TaxID=160799 RepID=A0ABX3HFP4_PAEBO|nr:hypothetical protein BSK56_11910 [Paenibacillus borealis]